MDILKAMQPDIRKLIRSIGNGWKSYEVDWEQPVEHRLWVPFNDMRFCLQRFDPCDGDPYYHNHPWHKEMFIVKGRLEQGISAVPGMNPRKVDRIHPVILDTIRDRELAKMEFGPFSYLSIDSPDCFHYLKPLDGPVYSIMLTMKPWHTGPKSPLGQVNSVSEEIRTDILDTINKVLDDKYATGEWYQHFIKTLK